MPNQFPTPQELETMPLTHLKNLDIRTLEEEQMVQEVLNKRISASPPVVKIDRSDVPFHITNKEDELKWQKVIDEREAQARGIKPEEVAVSEIQSEIQRMESEKKILETELKTESKFCNFCDSKGGRHKKNCTR